MPAKPKNSGPPIDHWRADPVAFIEECLINPETGEPYILYDAQIRFLREAFKLTQDGKLRYPELVYSAPKKSGKTALAAMIVIYAALILGGRYAEVYCLANDLEQSQGRVFAQAVKIIQSSPRLAGDAKVTADRITFSSGSFIQAVASDYAGFAGANPTLCVFDELWAFTSESSRRLWEEAVFSPTRKISGRLTVTYAGFSGESVLLEELYGRGMAGDEVSKDLFESPGMLMYWTHDPPAPWQNAAWREQMRQTHTRANAYLRHVENRFVTAESVFIAPEAWDACVDPNMRPVVSNRGLEVWVGVDASVKRDSTAIAVCTWDDRVKQVRLVWHRIFQPSPERPLDFEVTIEKTLRDLAQRFEVRDVRYDPYQLVSVAQRLGASGLPMVEWPQTTPNITEHSSNLFELINARSLVVYPDADIRLAVQRCVAIEIPARGWKIGKEKNSHKIDIVVALAMAALGAVKGGQPGAGNTFHQMAACLVSWGGPPPREQPQRPGPVEELRRRLMVERKYDPNYRCPKCTEAVLEWSPPSSWISGVFMHSSCPRDQYIQAREHEQPAVNAEVLPAEPNNTPATEQPEQQSEIEPPAEPVSVDSYGARIDLKLLRDHRKTAPTPAPWRS